MFETGMWKGSSDLSRRRATRRISHISLKRRERGGRERGQKIQFNVKFLLNLLIAPTSLPYVLSQILHSVSSTARQSLLANSFPFYIYFFSLPNFYRKNSSNQLLVQPSYPSFTPPIKNWLQAMPAIWTFFGLLVDSLDKLRKQSLCSLHIRKLDILRAGT